MGETAISPPGTLVVDVHIDQGGGKELRSLTWYYNGLSSKSFSIRVPENFGKIQFRLDAESRRNFAFDTPTIEQYWSDDEHVYGDLTFDPSSATPDSVTINDAQLNRSLTVGSITLAVQPKDAGQVKYRQRTLKSDPEVTNTGSNNG